MALSGSFSVSQRNGYETVRCDWTGTQSIANNTTTITAKLYFINQYAISIGERTHTITIDGTAYSITSSAISTTGEHYLGSVSHTVTHSSDGTKSIAMSFVFSLKATLSGTYYESMSKSASFTLNTIARTSKPTLSASSVAFGSNITITTNRASSSFTHHLYYSINGGSEVAITSGIGASYTWTVPTSLMNNIPSATSATIKFRLYTFSGSTNIGSETVSFTATVPSTVVPSISAITCTDTMNYLSTYGGYVQNKSKVKVAVTASGAYSSTIKSYKIVANGSTYSSNNCTTNVLTTAGTNTITVTVTDSRGRTKTSSTTISVLDYTSPTIATLSAFRCDAEGNADENGEYISISADASISGISDLNSKSFVLEYKLSSEESYQNIETYSEDYAYSKTVETLEVGSDDMVEIKLSATDDFSTTVAIYTVGTAYTLLDFNASGKGVAFGKVSTEDGFDVDMETRFRQALRSELDVIAGLGSDNQISLLDLAGSALESNNDYVKIGNYVIQWGTEEVTVRLSDRLVQTARRVFDIPFVDTNYVLISGVLHSIASSAYYDCKPSYADKAATYFTGRVYSNGGGFTTTNFPTNVVTFEWVAFGRWK